MQKNDPNKPVAFFVVGFEPTFFIAFYEFLNITLDNYHWILNII